MLSLTDRISHQTQTRRIRLSLDPISNSLFLKSPKQGANFALGPMSALFCINAFAKYVCCKALDRVMGKMLRCSYGSTLISFFKRMHLQNSIEVVLNQ